ncbi:MAG: isoaspartyl peptidase/L-asparaginase [Chitinophagales bacterium]|jgi:L-asparaginase|nr:isoaspartyl peptidase/L-asparaginase [Chitinophagales bacterium]
MKPKLLIHGGFFSESLTDDKMKQAKIDSMKAIITKSYDYLKTHTARETAIYAVCLLEDDPLYNAGTGSQIQSDGQVRMSASLMDSESMKFSGVINIESVQNPIKIAAILTDYDDRVLGGLGANEFAKKHNFPYYNPITPQRQKEFLLKKESHGLGTVGCVALDTFGNLAAATSTGGKGFEIVGRVSDSATIAGNYCNEHCAISCTGVGEDIVAGGIATKIVTRVTDGMEISKAFQRTFDELKTFDGFAGAIGIDAHGNWAFQESHPSMVFCAFDGETLLHF